jgi:O-antigen/teichoic acid export membrane protein
MTKRRIFFNAASSVGSVIAISLILFVLYRYLLMTIGVARLGVWSLVLATTSLTQIANFGLSGSVVKYVAKYVAMGRLDEVSSIIQTAALSVAGFIGAVLMAGYPLARWLLRMVVPDGALPEALAILPLAFLTFWFMAISSVFLAGLDGFQRILMKNLLLTGGSVLYLVLCFVLAPRFGLRGVALARVAQDLSLLVSGWILLKTRFRELPLIPHVWTPRAFREIIVYGINFQIISFMTLCYDPLTKALLSKFGGLSSVGYYEMASRMVQQLRSLIVSANQVLVPAIADLQEKVPARIRSIYRTSYQLLFYLAVPLYSMIILALPLVSWIWIGRVERGFVLFGVFLSLGWFFNTLNVPAYFANLGMGELKWNVISHVSIALLNLALGLWLGRSFGGIGVIGGWAVALAAGSSLILLSYHFRHRIPFGELIPPSSGALTGVSLAAILAFFFMMRFRLPSKDPAFLSALILVVFFGAILIPLWRNPMRRKLAGWIVNDMAGRKQET